MVNIRGRNPEEFSRALTAFDQHLRQLCIDVSAGLRAVTLAGGELGASFVGQENPSQTTGAPSGSAPDPWASAPQSAPQGNSQGFSGGQQSQSDQNDPPKTPPPHVGQAPSCSHGVKTFLSGKYKSGKPGYWMAWACPAQRNDSTKHDLDFIRQG